MSGHSRTLTAMLSLAAVFCVSSSATAQITRPVEAPKIIHACYVPLTGTVYRVGESGLHATCTSATHVPFQWTDGDGALYPGDAAGGDLLQFDGKQWQPVRPETVGGMAGYEIVSQTISNSYGPRWLAGDDVGGIIISDGSGGCEGGVCASVYRYQTSAPAATVILACPTGKKAIGFFGGNGVAADILSDGRVAATIPASVRYGPTQLDVGPYNESNHFPDKPSISADTYSVKLVCAFAN